jgi:hypothetical protein
MSSPSVTITLKDFFDVSDLTPQHLAALESNAKLTSLRDVLSRRAPDVTWPAALGEITRKTDDLLQVNIPEVAAAAWNKYQVLRKYSDPEKYSSCETIMVPLATHTIRSVHKPYVEILAGDEPVGRVDFEIDLELVLEGVLLSIRGGKIVEMRIGSCQGKGSASCEGIVLAKRETKSFLLPGSIALKDGIPIAPAQRGGPRSDA